MRTLKELLIILRDNARVKKTLFWPRINSGLCNELMYLYNTEKLTVFEVDIALDYIRINTPKSDKNRIGHKSYLFKPGRWRCRKRWLNKQIKQLD